MSGLLTCKEFRRIRDEQALKAAYERLPILDAQIEALEAEIRPIYIAYYGEHRRHEREKIYAQFDGRDKRFWELVIERDAIQKRVAQLVANASKSDYNEDTTRS